MSINLPPLSQNQLSLPNIDLIERSEQAFGEAFLKAAQILYRQLEEIKSAILITPDFTQDPFNLALFGLFSKICSHYYSYVCLEIQHDQIGGQFLIEHLYEAAITLTYLLEEEEVDKSRFAEYISASVHQARSLVIAVEKQLQQLPNHPDLLMLREQLETFITNQQEHVTGSLSNDSEAYLWGPQSANTTAKREAVIGLNFLTNPARQIALRVMPASWLELQLIYLNSFAKTRTQAQPGINFTRLRNAAHLCLHATQSLLEEVINHQHVNLSEIKLQQQLLNVLYEWFYDAHHVYQRHYGATIQERHGL